MTRIVGAATIAPSRTTGRAAIGGVAFAESPEQAAEHDAHYPSIKPELVQLTAALHGLAHNDSDRAQFIADASGYADKFKLSHEHRAALLKLEVPSIVKMGVHPLVPFLANMQIQRLRNPH